MPTTDTATKIAPLFQLRPHRRLRFSSGIGIGAASVKPVPPSTIPATALPRPSDALPAFQINDGAAFLFALASVGEGAFCIPSTEASDG